MICRVCGGSQERRVTDFPFRFGDHSVVVVKGLPVLECSQCGDTELENKTMIAVEALLGRVDSSAELEVVRFAA